MADSQQRPQLPFKGPNAIRQFYIPAFFVLALFVALVVRRPGPEDALNKPWIIQGEAFGTTYSIKLIPGLEPSVTPQELRTQFASVIENIDQQMSTYKSDSELSVLNNNPSLGEIKLSKPLFSVLNEALRVYQFSDGAFDVTVGPVVNAWGFGPNKTLKPPADDVLSAARARVGSDKLALSTERQSLKRLQSNLYIDLSAIAKGYAVDALSDVLEGHGITDYMAEIGGEVRARGGNASGKPWRIGIEKPVDAQTQVVELVVPLIDQSMATSGNYRNYVMHDGRRVSHAIDGRTGQPVMHGLASVTVLHKRCMTADALATALYVLGPDKGLALANANGIAALFLLPIEGGFEQRRSDAFPPAD